MTDPRHTAATVDDAPAAAPVDGRPARRRRRSRPGRPPRRRLPGRWVALLVTLAILVLVVSAVLVGLDALRAQASLRTAGSAVGTLRTQVLDGDREAAATTLDRLRSDAAEARADTHGPHWWLAARMPVVGASVKAVQTVTEVVDGLATGALPELADATAVLDPAVLSPQEGRIELAPFIEIAPRVTAADDEVREAAIRLGAADSDRVLPEVRGPLTELRGMVDDLAMTTATASRAVQLLPSMLGAYGERRYVLVAQNPAEARATGGILGAWISLTASDGSITLGEQFGAGPFSTEEPVVELTAEETDLFTERLAVFGANPSMTPDFPRTAEIVSAMWTGARGEHVDGVVSVDPVVLQRVLGVTGPVELADGRRLDGDNAARVLLNEVYVELFRAEEQDAVFADAARAAFTRLLAGGGNPAALLPALASSADEGRLMLWSSDPREQSLLSGTVLSGELLGEVDGAPELGVYLNDASATKMSYYLDTAVTVERTSCLSDGARALTLTLDIASTAPEEVSSYPDQLTGRGWLTPGEVWTNVMVYSPAGGRIDAVRLDGSEESVTGFYAHEGMVVSVTRVTLTPGASHVLEVDVETAAGQDAPARVRTTPLASPTEVVVNDSPC